jgi:hypothetical protein
MGEAKRRKQLQEQAVPSHANDFHGIIDLQWLPPVSTINAARIRELTGDATIPISDTMKIVLQAFRVVVGKRIFHVGFCLGDKTGFSAIGIAVIDRLMLEVPGASLYVVPVVHRDIAWDIVLRHLRNFTGQILLFAFPDSDVYDAGTAEMCYSNAIRLFDPEGKQTKRLTAAQRRKIEEQAAEVLNRPLPKMYAAPGEHLEDIPWIFRVATPEGKVIRTAVWNGRRDYAHELPEDIVRWVGGEKIAIAQVDKPVGINLRSSLNLTHFLAKDFDGVIHWARDTETFQSILKSFIRLDLESVSPPELAIDWNPEVIIIAANN